MEPVVENKLVEKLVVEPVVMVAAVAEVVWFPTEANIEAAAAEMTLADQAREKELGNEGGKEG